MSSNSWHRQLLLINLFLAGFLTFGHFQVQGQYKPAYLEENINSTFSQNGKLILQHYESKAYQLKPSKAGHMGLRLYRHYQDDKYAYLMLQGVLYTDKALNKLVKNGLDSLSIEKFIKKNNKSFKTNTQKKKLRKKTLKTYPRYRYMATKVLRHVARLDELGLQHKKHKKLIQLLEGYHFQKVFTDPMMIKAWGAQLANQVYWLKQIGIADYTVEFMQAVEKTYPHKKDRRLSNQQFENKIYTLTHILIAASGYYQTPLNYNEYAGMVDYLRENTPMIIKRVKEDVLIEVGISLLLVDESYPEIYTIRNQINSKIDMDHQMIRSKKGSADFAKGEHRNIIAVLLLDWQGCSSSPTRKDVKKLNAHLPNTLKFKKKQDKISMKN